MAGALSQCSRVVSGGAIRVQMVSSDVRSSERCVAVVASFERYRLLSLKMQVRGEARWWDNSALWSRRQLRRFAVVARLFDPEDFNSSKLTVRFKDDAKDLRANSVEELLPRKYTLTHSDVTGELLLSIGPSFNQRQLADWYTRLMRDEIVAEWRGSGQISLHVHCHVSGGHILLAPAALRNSIFEREMPLVLAAIRHGDKELLAEYPELDTSTVWVHFHSSDPEYNRADCWGPLFYAASPMRRVTGKLVSSSVSVPFKPHTVIEVQKDLVELCRVPTPTCW